MLKSSAGKNSYWSNGIQDTSLITVTNAGVYTVSKDSICATGSLVSAPVEIEFFAAPEPQVNAAILIPGDSVLLTANGENCAWYGAATGGNILAVGYDFQTPPLFSDTVFYVESRFNYPGEIQFGGKPDSLGFSPPTATNKEMHFTAWEPFTLLSTDVFLPAQALEGERVFRLLTDTGAIAETTAFLYKGKNVVPLNFQVPSGSFSLACDQAGQWQLVGSLDYPYPIGDVGQLDSSSKGLNFYPYFFNWKIQKMGITCVSPRTAVSIGISDNREVITKLDFKVFPIPTSNMLHVVFNGAPTTNVEAVVLDFTGRVLSRQPFFRHNSLILNTAELPSGIYQLMMIVRDGVASKIFIIEN